MIALLRPSCMWRSQVIDTLDAHPSSAWQREDDLLLLFNYITSDDGANADAQLLRHVFPRVSTSLLFATDRRARVRAGLALPMTVPGVTWRGGSTRD